MKTRKKIWTNVKPSETDYVHLVCHAQYDVFRGGESTGIMCVDAIDLEYGEHPGTIYSPAIDDWIPESDFDRPLYVSIEDFEQRKKEIGEQMHSSFGGWRR